MTADRSKQFSSLSGVTRVGVTFGRAWAPWTSLLLGGCLAAPAANPTPTTLVHSSTTARPASTAHSGAMVEESWSGGTLASPADRMPVWPLSYAVPADSDATVNPAPNQESAATLDTETDSLEESSGNQQAEWGLAVALRTAQIPYDAKNDSVSSLVPMMFYEGEHFFLRGLAGGVHLWDNDQLELNLLARGRFVDIPDEYQNQVQGDTVDFGVQGRMDRGDAWGTVEVLSDEASRMQFNARVGGFWRDENFEVLPSLNLRYLSERFNERYYALGPITGDTAGSGWQLSPEVALRYHVYSDLYLVGTLRYTFNDDGIYELPAVDTRGQYEFLLGFGFFQHGDDEQFLGHESSWGLSSSNSKEISTPAYVRLAYGEATPSDLGEIINFKTRKDPYENRLGSVFYGHPLTDQLFGVPMDLYLTPGFVWHESSEVQDSTQEYVLAIKAYYTIEWPLRWRLGFAEGLSWIEEITYIEQQEMDRKDYRPSQLMNYLDFSLDINLGDLFGSKSLQALWLGYSIHHRSSIFESASQFGRIWGGSNYQTGYLQWDLL